ncbi:MAG: sulfatase [Verrucomicrobiota bacterium]
MWTRVLLVWSCLFGGALAERPNILMIAIDDLRPMLGCYGDTRVKTPNIDRLASRSTVYERAYCQYAKCGTSRLSIMTGLRPDSIGVFSNNDKDVKAFRERSQVVSMGRYFKESGYHTQSFGKIYHDGWDEPRDWSVPSSPGREREMWEVVDEKNPQGPTFIAERWACPVWQNPDVSDEHLYAGRMTNEVIAQLGEVEETKPFFFAVGYRRPHLPFVAPKRYFDLYQPDKSWLTDIPNPPKGSPVMAWFNSDGYVGGAKRVGLVMPKRPSRQEAMDWNGYEMRSYLNVAYEGTIPEQKQLELLHAYAACVSYVDAQIGKLLEHFDPDNTIIVLWSDHGWHLGEYSAWGKMTNFEIATRVPMMIAQPKQTGQRSRQLAELVDLYPTLCDLAGIPQPPHLEGESLVADSERNDVALSQYARFGRQYMGRAIRTERYRYVAWFEEKSGGVVERELYDHETDPGETKNLAANPESAAVVERLHIQVLERFTR